MGRGKLIPAAPSPAALEVLSFPLIPFPHGYLIHQCKTQLEWGTFTAFQLLSVKGSGNAFILLWIFSSIMGWCLTVNPGPA